MGIELPAELAEIAEVTGTIWPEADEDALAEQAAAWRQAAWELATLAGDADASAGRAFGTMSGPAEESARGLWASFVDPDSGAVTEAVRGARQAADRLDHAAEQVGRAKVEIVRQLVETARNRDAAMMAAEAGYPAALLGIDTALRGTAANLGAVTEGLVGVVGSDDPRGFVPGGDPVAPGPGAHPAHGQASLLGAVTGLPDDVLAPELSPEKHLGDELGGAGADSATEGPFGSGDRAEEEPDDKPDDGNSDVPVMDTLPPETPPPDTPLSEALSSAASADGEDTGPIAVSQAPTPPTGQYVGVRGLTDMPTPPSGTPLPGGSAVPAPSVMPGQTHLAGFTGAAGGGYPQAPAVPAAQQFAPPPLGQQQFGGQHFAGQQFGPPSLGPQQFGPHYPGSQFGGQGGAGAPHAVHPPAGAAPAPSTPQGPPPGLQGQRQQGHPHGQGACWGAPRGYSPWAVPPQSSAPPRPPQLQPPARAQSQPPGPAVPVGAPRQERESIVALFLVHMFPIGHLPVASDRPAIQLPVPASAEDSGTVARFPPHDHPRSDEIDDERALAALHGGGRRPAPPPAEVLPRPPAALSDGHDPLGGTHERDWDRRYLVRDGDPPEYAWPPYERYPEGGREPGEPVTLAEGTLIDRFGTPHGRVYAADGTPFARRSLPPAHLRSGYRRYRVLRELPVWETISAAWFGQLGGGVRYRSVYSAAELVTLGYLADITFEERA